MAIDIEKFKKQLNDEKIRLEESLSRLAVKNPKNPDDWEPTPAKMNAMTADKTELADTFDEFENRAAIEGQLEGRLNRIKYALEQIKKGTYGICATCKCEIQKERLEANPAAKNCIKHANG